MKSFALTLLLFCVAWSASVRNGRRRTAVSPEFLDQLLTEERYDEFEEYVGITVPGLSRPDGNSTDDPSRNPNLFEGDIVLTPEMQEMARQGIRFDRRPSLKWPGKPAIIPYSISKKFTDRMVRIVNNAVTEFNQKMKCVKYRLRRNETDYVFVFPGDGCHSIIGRAGGQQTLSLGKGCDSKGIAMHELEHGVGFAHEHNRLDRDDYIKVLLDNIDDKWKPEYEKTNEDSYGIQGTYDYYSIMHYAVKSPGRDEPAFEILMPNIDKTRVGQRAAFTQQDLDKVSSLYC